MSKELFEETDSYKVYTEFLYGQLFLHCDVLIWNKTTFKELESVLDSFDCPVYAACNDDKHKKFLDMLGFMQTGVAIRQIDGKFREVYVHGFCS